MQTKVTTSKYYENRNKKYVFLTLFITFTAVQIIIA